MRKLLLTTAAVAAAIGLAGCGSGTFTDSRDGQKYRTVIMPDGKRWMAQNLNYKTDSSWCYENSVDSCTKYGRLYTWNAAMKACPTGYHLPSHEDWNYLTEIVGGKRHFYEDGVSDHFYWIDACEKLKAKHGWDRNEEVGGGIGAISNSTFYVNGNGSDDYGFSALPGGSGFLDIGFHDVGIYGIWWTAMEDENNYSFAYCRSMSYRYQILSELRQNKVMCYSVRCVADRP